MDICSLSFVPGHVKLAHSRSPDGCKYCQIRIALRVPYHKTYASEEEMFITTLKIFVDKTRNLLQIPRENSDK